MDFPSSSKIQASSAATDVRSDAPARGVAVGVGSENVSDSQRPGMTMLNRPDSIFSLRGRLPCLDGWRALAITLVIGAHSRESEGFPDSFQPLFQKIFDGNLGVRIFFVISGFLITLLMIRENEAAPFSLKNFWYRRVLRILPVYVTYLFVLFLLQTFTNFEMSAREWLGALTFTANYTDGEGFLALHLWSLSVEEQFYIIWPLIFYLYGRRTRELAFLAASMIATSIGARLAWQFYPDVVLFKFTSLLTNLDSLAVGCTFAYLAYWKGDQFVRWNRSQRLIVFGVLAVIVPRLILSLDAYKWMVEPVMPFLQAVGFGTLMVISISQAKDVLFKWLQWQPIEWIGVLSYSLYIWQQIFCARSEVFGIHHDWWLRFPTWILCSLVTAMFSFYVIEKPFMNLKKRFRI